MPYKIEVDGKLIVAGIPWRVAGMTDAGMKKKGRRAIVEADPVKLERAIAKERKAVLVAGAPTWAVKGFLTADDKKEIGKTGFKKLYALAEILANVPSLPTSGCVIFVAPLPADRSRYVMCVVANGEPMPDPKYDTVIGEDEVSDTLYTWSLDLSNDQNQAVTTIGDWASAETQMTLEEAINQSVGYGPLRTVASDGKSLRLLIMAVIIGGAGFYGYGQYKHYMAKKAAAEAAKKANPVVVYRNALTAAWSQQVWSSRERALALVKQIGDYEPVAAGFRMKPDSTIDCDVANGACKFTFARDGGTFAGFADEAAKSKRFTSISYGLNGETIEVTTQISGLPESKAPAIESLPAEDEIPVLFWTEIQLMPRDLVKGALGSGFKLYPAGVAVNEAALPLRVRTVDIKLDGPLWDADGLAPNTDLFTTGVNYKAVHVRLKAKGVSLLIEGELYVRKKS